MIKETWKFIVGYNKYYAVSNYGRVYSCERLIHCKNGRIYTKPGKLLRRSISGDGYYVVDLAFNGKSRQVRVHRLVAQAFIPNPHHYPIVNHKDENKLNDRANNLEWCTVKYNDAYGTRGKRIAIHESKPIELYKNVLFHKSWYKDFNSTYEAAFYVVHHSQIPLKLKTAMADLGKVANGVEKRKSVHGYHAVWINSFEAKQAKKRRSRQVDGRIKANKTTVAYSKYKPVVLFKSKFIKKFNSAKSASKWVRKTQHRNTSLHAIQGHITAVCRGKRKHCYGFSAKYLKP